MTRSTENISFKGTIDTVAAAAVASLLLGAAFPVTVASDVLGIEIGSYGELTQFFSKEIFDQTSPYITVSLGFVAIGATLYISAVNRSGMYRQREIRDNELLILFARLFNLISAWIFAFTSLGAVLLLRIPAGYEGPRFMLLFTGVLCWALSCCFAGLCSPGEIANAKSLNRLRDQCRKARQLRAELDELRSWSDETIAKNYAVKISLLSSSLHALCLLLCWALLAFIYESTSFGVLFIYGLVVAPMCYFLYFYTVCSLFVYFRRGAMYRISVLFVGVIVLVMYLMAQVGLSSKILGYDYSLDLERSPLSFIVVFSVLLFLTVLPVATVYLCRNLKSLIHESRIFYLNAELASAKQAISRLKADEAAVYGSRVR